ncbi:disks large 1 tumor suppressor protein isoform X21 [Drosophila teissieri]|uniref:disks large 1 tumor suppressor protein isoform X21 n=1 Tax=Drosophila teissieri TaxID=7243 RepID=UPI001CBA42A7|nr:disks large 1 tumor suppressor protein isoform X21 [Drosophila teissieri]
MPVKKQEAHRALELLEDYHARLSEPQDRALRIAIERVIRIFKSRLFQALLDIQEFYELTLLDDSKSIQQKTAETLQIATKWEKDGQAVKIADNQRMRIESDTENAKEPTAEQQQQQQAQQRSSRSPQQQNPQQPQQQQGSKSRSGSQTQSQIQIQSQSLTQTYPNAHQRKRVLVSLHPHPHQHQSQHQLQHQHQHQHHYQLRLNNGNQAKMLKRAFEST